MKNNYKHAKERFLKRHGRSIETEQIQALEELIRRNKVVSLTRAGGGRMRVALKVGEEYFYCIVAEDGVIITFIDISECKHRYTRAPLVKNGNRKAKRPRLK